METLLVSWMAHVFPSRLNHNATHNTTLDSIMTLLIRDNQLKDVAGPRRRDFYKKMPPGAPSVSMICLCVRFS